MKEIQCEQYSPEWWKARAGIPTASMYGDIITPKGTATTTAKTETALNTVLASWLAGGQVASFSSFWMKRGTELEPEAREKYEWITENEVEEVGFCIRENKYGASPDGIISDSNGFCGVLEIKCPAPQTHVSYLRKSELPTQYIPQVQGQMFVTDTTFCHFVSYCPGLPLFMIEANRDEAYISTLNDTLLNFWDLLELTKGKLIAQGYKPNV